MTEALLDREPSYRLAKVRFPDSTWNLAQASLLQAREHGFQLIPRADPMKKRQDEVCSRGVEDFGGISVKGIYELLEESLGYDALRCPEHGEESCFEFLDRYRSIKDWFKAHGSAVASGARRAPPALSALWVS